MANNHNIALNIKGLLESAVSKLNKRYDPDNISAAGKQDLQTAVLEKLPEDTRYVIKSIMCGDPKDLSTFKIYVTTEDLSVEGLEGWLAEYQTINQVTLRVKAKKKQTKGYLVQNYYRCQHNTRNRSPNKDPQKKLKLNPTARVKNTNCPFQLAVKIDSSNICHINIDLEHNHSTTNLESSNFKDLSDDCLLKVKQLYAAGHTPAAARQQFLKELKASCINDIDYHLKKADRSITPRRRDFHYLYDQYNKENFGGKNVEMYEKLAEKIGEYNKEHPEASTHYQLYGGDETPLLIAIVTPLMKRVHQNIPQSGELLFVDATSNTEEHNLKVFLFCTHNVAGALPCGVLITSDEKESTLKHGFQMLKNCFPEDAFYGRGRDSGPKLILTDNCKEERNALQFTWPLATLLLCIFHILQQTWRWLLERKHGISQSHRPHIFNLFKTTLYANSEESFEECYSDLLGDEIVQSYENALEYFEDLQGAKQEFALCFRSDLMTRGNRTNNFVEAQFLVLKDVILKRMREYNVVALIGRITVDLENHYKDKMLSIADGSFDGSFRSRFIGKGRKVDPTGYKIPTEEEKRIFMETIKTFPNDVFEVQSLSDVEKRYSIIITQK
jgi:hypothetical protein